LTMRMRRRRDNASRCAREASTRSNSGSRMTLRRLR
jgi:hypothetical protein